MKGFHFIFLAANLIINICNCNGLVKFRNGRYEGGSLGDPSVETLKSIHVPPDSWFDQILDHFDTRNNITWKQRYFTNSNFYTPGSPIFLMIGGEGEAKPKWMVEGAWIHYAKTYNALCFQLEHRFYGKSHPTSDISIENLIYLTSQQALADLAHFIEEMNKQYSINIDQQKWIVFGGSYPGSLAAWLRQKYPNLVYGAISSSGPLLAQADFVEYYNVVEQSLGTYSEDCVIAVRKGFSQIDILLKHMIGQRSLDLKFKLCTPIEKSIENIMDVTNLYENIASNFAGVVQYNKDNSPNAKVTIDEVCNIMVNKTIGPPINRLAEVNELMLLTNNAACLDYTYDKMIKDLKNTSWLSDVAKGDRQWTYQTCNEFGFYQTSESSNSIFNDKFPLNFFIKQCEDVYGTKFNADFLTRSIKYTNSYYGGLNPATTNVIYVHGTIDPWHALGLTKSNDINLQTLYINGTAHCANMYEPRDSDSRNLKNARIIIDQYIKKLLNK